MANSPSSPENSHQLQCMEIWSGNRSVENTASSPGLEAWIFSQPYNGESRGGDVHYLSLCVGGIVTRFILADVSGHGLAVDDTSQILKKLLRRFMNSKSQNGLMADLNHEFSELEQRGRFATAVVATYLSHKRRLLITNAGHPRPLLFRQSSGTWEFLSDDLPATKQPGNLPLGIIASTKYQQHTIPIGAGDWMLLYTDALTEATDSNETMLGETGLLALARRIPMTPDCSEFGRTLMSLINEHTQGKTPGDDVTLMVVRFTETRRVPGIAERLSGYRALIRNAFS